jgi:hypothetical protein
VDRLVARIEEGLRTLQDEGVTGLTIPTDPLG